MIEYQWRREFKKEKKRFFQMFIKLSLFVNVQSIHMYQKTTINTTHCKDKIS